MVPRLLLSPEVITLFLLVGSVTVILKLSSLSSRSRGCTTSEMYSTWQWAETADKRCL